MIETKNQERKNEYIIFRLHEQKHRIICFFDEKQRHTFRPYFKDLESSLNAKERNKNKQNKKENDSSFGKSHSNLIRLTD